MVIKYPTTEQRGIDLANHNSLNGRETKASSAPGLSHMLKPIPAIIVLRA